MTVLKDNEQYFRGKLDRSVELGCSESSLGFATLNFLRRYPIAFEYVSTLAPVESVSMGGENKCTVFNPTLIEEGLSGWDYSKELVELGLLPIASLENDKVCCFDCIYYGFVVLQLNFGTIEPLRKYILFRANDFMRFVELLSVLP